MRRPVASLPDMRCSCHSTSDAGRVVLGGTSRFLGKETNAIAETCRRCRDSPHPLSGCPAKGKNMCRVRQTKPFHQSVQADMSTTLRTTVNTALKVQAPGSDMDDDEDETQTVHSIFMISTATQKHERLPNCKEVIAGCPMAAIVDTGASINVLAEATHRSLQPRPPLTLTRVRVLAYGQFQPLTRDADSDLPSVMGHTK
ncbi:hypothetical protein NDU88_001767 [Pleurodeles waltl]|uniref:Peptidase A2 domain-containing protein n=1 Tax=Pleurodeles waltl TaxID=8319 RepID=A0AAV7W069_PLEWA|nr:hypothetical protein NDU88_001767 [Pleurodeles waltl]